MQKVYEWILVLVLTGGDGQGSIDHVEFRTKVACEAARSRINKDYAGGLFSYKIRSYCVHAGTAPDGRVEK